MSRVESDAAPFGEGQSHCQRASSSEARSGIWRKAQRSNHVPEGRQLRDSIHSRVRAVPRHHAATSDTPTKGAGAAMTRRDWHRLNFGPGSRAVAAPVVSGRQSTHHRVAGGMKA